MNRLTLCVILLFEFAGVTGQSIPSDHYSIYSKVLNAFLKEEKVKGKRVVLEKETRNQLPIQGAMFDSTLSRLSYKLDSANKNKSEFDLFELKNYKLTLVEGDIIAQWFDGNIEQGWIRFRKVYPNSAGLVRMSKLYLEPNRTWGLIYISVSRGGLNGAGYIIKFDLTGKKIILTKEQLWVS